MEQIKSGETPDEGFGFIGNWVPVWTLIFKFGVGDGRVVCTKGVGGGVAAEDIKVVMASADKMNLVVCPSVACVFEDFGGDVAERAGEVSCPSGEWRHFGLWRMNTGVGNGRETCMPKSTMIMSLLGSVER